MANKRRREPCVLEFDEMFIQPDVKVFEMKSFARNDLDVDDIFARELENYLREENQGNETSPSSPPPPPQPQAVLVQRIDSIKCPKKDQSTQKNIPSQAGQPNAYELVISQDDRPLLILDLDHTLLNSLNVESVAPVHRQFLEQNRDVTPGLHLVLDNVNAWTKLRPGAREFVKQVGEVYQIVIYTMGQVSYAMAMGNLLDPECKYLSPDRLIARLPNQDSMKKSLAKARIPATSAVIVDDSPEVWAKSEHANLFQMPRYMYFGPDSIRQDEGEKNPLSSLAPILIKLANAYKEKGGDIRTLIPELRSSKRKKKIKTQEK